MHNQHFRHALKVCAKWTGIIFSFHACMLHLWNIIPVCLSYLSMFAKLSKTMSVCVCIHTCMQLWMCFHMCVSIYIYIYIYVCTWLVQNIFSQAFHSQETNTESKSYLDSVSKVVYWCTPCFVCTFNCGDCKCMLCVTWLIPFYKEIRRFVKALVLFHLPLCLSVCLSIRWWRIVLV